MASRLSVSDGESKVAFGRCSVFDVFAVSADDLPFEVPVSDYVEEVLIGLDCAPEASPLSATGQRMPGTPSSQSSQSSPSRAKYSRLRRIVGTQALSDACLHLFWIAVGVITNRVAHEAVQELRNRLARAWCLVALEVKQQAHRDTDTQDWLLMALPAILVQAVYRLFVDCFPDDRTQYIHFVDALLEKLSYLVTFEVCGFQRNAETCVKERRLLFKKVVLENPYVNQRDSVKAQQRKEELEKRAKAPPPLKFGKSIQQGGEILEETQLEHVMMCREAMAEQRKLDKLLPAPVPEELSVDRYTSVAMEGSALFERQFEELRPRTVIRRQSSASAFKGLAIEIPDDVKASPPPEDELQRLSFSRGTQRGDSRPTTSQRVASMTAKMKAAARTSCFASRLCKAHKTKDDEAAEKRRREDSLRKRIVDDPLPQEFRECALDTTWVSPITNRLAPGERDRQALRKRSAEAYQLKMEPKSTRGLPTLMPRCASSPDLGASHASSRGASLGASLSMTASQELPKLARQMASDGEAAGADVASLRPASRSATGQHSKKEGGANAFGVTSKGLRQAQAEELTLEPPPSLHRDVVMHRLEGQLSTFHANSFGNYVKEFDITSGDKKQRMDPAAMRKAETTYVSLMQDLVGPPEEPALRCPRGAVGCA